jgi:hypothetical protein
MASWLIALDKCTRTHPVGIRETYCYLWAKCLLHAHGVEATAGCANLNLCTRLLAKIEGGIHALCEV